MDVNQYGYLQGLQLEGTLSTDAGAWYTTAMRIRFGWGAPSEEDCAAFGGILLRPSKKAAAHGDSPGRESMPPRGYMLSRRVRLRTSGEVANGRDSLARTRFGADATRRLPAVKKAT
jgi:hypothetical protein